MGVIYEWALLTTAFTASNQNGAVSVTVLDLHTKICYGEFELRMPISWFSSAAGASRFERIFDRMIREESKTS